MGGGEARGCFNLGVLYAAGQGVTQSVSAALTYYGKACDLKEEKGCKAYATLKGRMK